jgi:AcrR family transcriptional regulator
VGIGTLYRNFPSRDVLVEAAYRTEVEHLCHAAAELLADNPPDVALEGWMERFVAYAAAKRGMKSALVSVAARSELFSETSAQITAAIETILRAGVETGTLRADVAASDVRNAMSAIWALGDGEDARAQAQTLVTIIVDGLRHGAGQ